MEFEGYNGWIIVEGDDLFVERGRLPGRYDGPPQTQRIPLDDVRGGFLEMPTPQRPGYLQLSVVGEPDYDLSGEELIAHPGVVTFTEAQRPSFECLHGWLENGGTLRPPVAQPGTELATAPLPPPAGPPSAYTAARGSAVVGPDKVLSWVTRHKVLTGIGAVLLLGVLGSALGGSDPTPARSLSSGAGSTARSSPPARISTLAATPRASKAQAVDDEYVMPNVVGMSLQDAQDKIQIAVGSFFYSTSHDVSGQGRIQVLDAGWQVCEQSVKAGRTFTARTGVDLGVVRLSENCP